MSPTILVLLTALTLLHPAVNTESTDEDNLLQRARIVKTIIIDPGHGGSKDPGAVGPNGYREKDLTLAIALKLRNLINADPELSAAGVKVVLTRSGDSRVGLEERATIANNAKGDLFVSIHANSFWTRSARGAETYFLNLKSSDVHARRVAEIENRDFEEQEQNVDEAESDDLKLILFDFIHKQYIAESKFLAEEIQAEFNRSLDNGNRGVKQAPFRVLKGVAMPAVLVEVDFISNPGREQLLRSEGYQLQFAASMLRAIKQYRYLKERGYTVASPTTTNENNANGS